MPTATIYSGAKASWLTNVAILIQDGGHAPPSLEHLLERVPDRVGTARNDGHVTAAENGYPRRDYRKGWDIWVRGAVDALRVAELVDGDDSALRWIGPQDGAWQVPFGGNLITIYGRAERVESRARHNFQFAVGSGYSDITVQVETRSHGTTYVKERTLTAHPLALKIPAMTEDEQRGLREDIERNGVELPVVLYADVNDLTPRGKPIEKILDGRHRAFFASVVGKPVRVEVFEGTEEQARDHVVSLNLRRRHLTSQQLAQAIARLYGEQAKAEAKEAKREGSGTRSQPGRGSEESPVTSNGQKRGQEAHERAFEKAGKPPGTSADAVKVMMTLEPEPDDPPEVAEELQAIAADVETGRIKKTATVKAQVKAARGRKKPRTGKGTVGENITSPRSTYRRMGEALGQLKVIQQEWEDGRTERIKWSHQRWLEAEARGEEIVELGQWLVDQIRKDGAL